MNIADCTWGLSVCGEYQFLYVDGGKFICTNFTIILFNCNSLKLIECNNGGIFENCDSLQILGPILIDNSLIQLHTGISTFRNSVCFFILFF
jgi:hypothetical protein